MLRALGEFEITGLHTTIPAHVALLSTDDFATVTHSTKWVEDEVDAATFTEAAAPEAVAADGAEEAEPLLERTVPVEVDGKRYSVKLWLPEAAAGTATPKKRSARPRPGAGASGGAAGSGTITAPMQGTIVKVLVAEGDAVEVGQSVLVLEAMKMENHISAEKAGTVDEVRVARGRHRRHRRRPRRHRVAEPPSASASAGVRALSGVTSELVRIAVVQRPPVLLDGPGTIAAAVEQVHEVAAAGARLVVFPEAYVPGYPVWIWHLRPGPDYALTSQIHAALLANAVDLDADGLAPLRDAAAERALTVVCGVHERDGSFGRSTLYNTLVTIGPDGAVLNRHRKLVPTNPERMVWGEGDARGLSVVDTPIGRLGGLICWENYMPLARVALYAEGVEIYVACTWDSGDTWLATHRHIAAEGRCFVIGSGCSLAGSDIPGNVPGARAVFGDLTLGRGGSTRATRWWCDPAARSSPDRSTRSTASCTPTSTSRVAASDRRTLDVVGHYARNDVFRFTVDRTARAPVVLVPPDDAVVAQRPQLVGWPLEPDTRRDCRA